MALIKKQLLAKEDMLLSADNTPVSQARAGTIISVHPVNASVIPFDGTRSIVEAVEDLAYTHPLTHPVSIIDGSSNPSKFVKTDTLGNTGFDNVTWAEIEGKPGTYTPSSHEHSLDEVTSGTLPASRIATSETRQFITAEQASQLLDIEIKSNKGIPNGYAPLDSNGKINSSFLSDLNLVEVFTPADLASMLAITSAQPGDIAYRQDNSTSYMLVALPASTEANWKSLNTGSQVISVNGQTGVVSLNTSNIAESTNLYFTNERVDDRVANLLQAGTNISLAYNDTSNTLTINANDTSVDWSEVQSKPTTISGYSITDAYTKTETDSALSLKAPLTSPTFAGTVALPSTTSIGNVSNTELGYLDGVTSSIQTQFNGKVSKTGDETIAGVKTLADGLKLQGQNVSPFGGFKNYIINGGFDIDQRNNKVGILIPAGSYAFTADRWLVNNTTNQPVSITVSDFHTNTGGRTGRLRIKFDTAPTTGSVQVFHRIENVATLGGKVVTLSHSFDCDTMLITNDLTQNFGTGGSPNTFTSFSSINTTGITSSLTRFSSSITVPSVEGKTIGTNYYTQITYNLPIRTTNIQTIAQVQLEEGSVATPFEQRPYGLELSLCQRYYEFGESFSQSPTFSSASNGTYTQFCTRKRTIPSLTTTPTFSNGSTLNAAISVTPSGFSWNFIPLANGGWCKLLWAASAEL